ncbi:hypothetical protein Sjap_001171 [Stephania japonica]|uniref:Uncharacterized protein n=1 Tax=Stephania japonica TaxID=461633 RepID=A0AAP0KJI4_9MAGN
MEFLGVRLRVSKYREAGEIRNFACFIHRLSGLVRRRSTTTFEPMARPCCKHLGADRAETSKGKEPMLGDFI